MPGFCPSAISASCRLHHPLRRALLELGTYVHVYSVRSRYIPTYTTYLHMYILLACPSESSKAWCRPVSRRCRAGTRDVYGVQTYISHYRVFWGKMSKAASRRHQRAYAGTDAKQSIGIPIAYSVMQSHCAQHDELVLTLITQVGTLVAQAKIERMMERKSEDRELVLRNWHPRL